MRPKTLQKILGHSSLKMTMDLYCYVSDDVILEEMAAVTKRCSSGVIALKGKGERLREHIFSGAFFVNIKYFKF